MTIGMIRSEPTVWNGRFFFLGAGE
jgi:hypothetical protein